MCDLEPFSEIRSQILGSYLMYHNLGDFHAKNFYVINFQLIFVGQKYP